MDLHRIDTEKQNPSTVQIDRVDTLSALEMINQQDALVAQAVKQVLPQVAQVVDAAYARVKAGGRLVYIGCGTSGRLGVLDAAECPPTFGVEEGLVVGVLAGGPSALMHAIEGAEDDEGQGEEDLRAIGFAKGDVLIGLAASGRTPYVLGAMRYAKGLGAFVGALVCASDSAMQQVADVTMAPLVGPEVIAGSTRLKSGTAEKMVLNMLSTTLMIKLGKVYQNLMVDVKASNEKLAQRCVDIVVRVTGAPHAQAKEAIMQSGGRCKTAIVMLKKGVDVQAAQAMLAKHEGHVSGVLEENVCKS